MAKNFKKKRLFTVAALTVLLALAMLVFASCETGKTYTLTFETGNGSAVSPIKAKAGDKIQLPDEPTLDGHRFDGWYLSEDFSGEKAALPETMPAENRTYYAKFTAIKTATLTLDAAGGVLETSVFELEAGEKVWRIVSQAVPSLTGAVFGGWFNGNSAVTENTVMPANGLTLTARYKASYVVEVYLEDLNGEYGAPTDQVTFEGGSDWLGREVRLGASVLKAPEGFLLDQTKTQPITLVAGENVYKAYFYRADGYVYYFVNTPQGAEAEGEMDFATVTYGAPHTVSESMFTVRGYRFAGWSDSPEGEVVYAAGDEISQVKGTIMLYARWNYGATDAGGGADRIYLLMESPLKAVLERPVLGEKTGSYDPDTRLFEFEIADGRTLKGRMHADGKGFAYFDGDMTLTLTQVDGTAAGKATIALDGLDAALYTPENGAATEGSYTRVSPSVYQFSSESVRFRFRIEKSDGEDVFVMSDGYEGTYYYYNGGISYPVVILDGFGAAAYLADSESSLLTGAYAPSGEEIEVTYPNGDGEVRFLCRLGEEQGRTTSGDVVTVTVFYLADDTRGEYAIEDLSGAETYFYSDGFGKAYYGEGAERREVDYVYYREHGYYVVIDGKINYFGFVSMYLDGKNVFGCLNMTAKTGGLAEHNTVWTEENARSGFTVKLRILDSRTAAIEVSMTNGRWQRVVTGENTYDGDAKIYHFAAEWFAPDTENIKYEQLLAPFYGDFYYKSQGTSSFVIADDAFSEYTVYDGSAVYTLKCDGFGKGSLLKRGDANSVPIVYDYRHGYETENASYGFISFTLQMSLFTVRVNEDTKEGQLVTEFTELENRLPEQGEKFCFAAVDYIGSEEVLYIPENITEVAPDAVQGLLTLKMVIFGDKVTTVGDRAFVGNPYLVSVIFGTGIDHIGDDAFSMATYLIDIHFPNAEKAPSYIGKNAFYRLDGIALVPSTTEWGGLMTVYVGGSFWGDASPSAYVTLFNVNNKAQDKDGNEVGAYSNDYSDFVTIASEAGTDKKGKTYNLADGNKLFLSGGDSAILFVEADGVTRRIWGAYRYDDYEKITFRAGFTVDGEAVLYYGKPSGDDFVLRDKVFGAYDDGYITVVFDGYGAASVVINAELSDGTYTLNGNEITFAGIDGLASASFIPSETQENSSKLTLTYGGSSHTLTYTGKEKGSYYDLKLGAKIELDGKNIDNEGGTAKIYFKHQEYERKYKLEGTKLYIIWIEGTDGSEDVLWNWSFNSSTRKITGYWNYHLDEYEYYFEFGLLAEGEEKGAYTSAAGDKLTLDGFFVAEYTPASGQAEKWNYFMMSDVSVLLTSGESYKLLVLDDASFTETEVTETSVAGQYYVAERSYKVWLDGNGNMLYDSNMSVYTYVVEGNVFKLTSYDDSGTPHVHEGKFALETDGYIETAFYSYGYSYLRLFKEKLEYTTVSFKLDDKSYTLAIFENKFVYAYQYGQAIAYTGSVADYAAAKAAIAAKEDFEVTLDGTVYTASYDSDSWAWTFTPKS